MKNIISKSINQSSKYFFSYLLKNATIVNADLTEVGDVLIEGNKIMRVDTNISNPSAKVIDCTGKLVIPGGIDTHTHMELPFMGTYAVDDFDSGSKAAITGGTTSFIDFAIPSKGQTLTQAYDDWRKKADPKVNCDYSLHSAIIEWNQQTPDHMKRMVENGISSFKFFMAYNNVLRIDDISMFKAFQCARELGAVCLIHAENGDIIQMNQKKLHKLGITGPQGHYLSRPESVEAEAVHRVITIAEHANCPAYIVHLMSRESTEEVMRAKNRGLLVYGETLAATIGTDGTKLWDKDWNLAAQYVMSPSLNPDPTVKTQIMKYLQSGVIDVIGTDNCTFCIEQKKLGFNQFSKIPNGVNGVQDRLAITWTKGVKSGLLSENQFVEITSTKAAQIFNMYPRKGVIRAGADADIVVWNPHHKRIISCKTHHQKVDYNIFQGQQVYGNAQLTFSNGLLVWNGQKFMNQYQGKFIQRKPFGFAYRRHQQWTSKNNPLNFKVDRSKQNQKGKVSFSQSTELTVIKKELQIMRQKMTELQNQLKTKQLQDKNKNFQEGQLIDTHQSLKRYLPPEVFQSIRQILYGNKVEEISMNQKIESIAQQRNIQIKHYAIKCQKEQTRSSKIVRLGCIQNKIVLNTTELVENQKHALMKRIQEIIEVAALSKVNIVCLQQIWTAPFFMCTRQRYPWVEFAEAFDGQSTQFLQKLAKQYNMVIVSSILQRQKNKQTLHNTAVIIDNYGQILGKQVKGHIPRVGDFNQSTYYMQGNSGHPIFQTQFGKIGVNICYGRHHPLHWMGFGLNGAQIVFNPSATINGLSQPLWAIQARNAAIANHYFAVGINRVGTQIYPNQFSSGDKKRSKKQFGHFYGSSYVAAPDGSRTPSLSRTNDGLLLTDIDLNMCRQIKDQWLFTMTGRHQLYAKLLQQYAGNNFQQQIITKKNIIDK